MRITTVPNESPVLLGHALVEHVPRAEPERRADLQRHAQAVEEQAGVELEEATGHGRHDAGGLALNSIANPEKWPA